MILAEIKKHGAIWINNFFVASITKLDRYKNKIEFSRGKIRHYTMDNALTKNGDTEY